MQMKSIMTYSELIHVPVLDKDSLEKNMAAVFSGI